MALTASYRVLDAFLQGLKNHTENEPLDINIFWANEPFRNLSFRDREIILSKLLKDGMIGSISKDPYNTGKMDMYFITFEGLMLLEMEKGYAGRHKKQKFLVDHPLILTRLIAAGTALAGLYACFQIYFLFSHPDQNKAHLNKDSCSVSSQKYEMPKLKTGSEKDSPQSKSEVPIPKKYLKGK